ncbi:cytidine deaminase [Vibrio sp. S4M6]|uniref:cytidine deaminase n=1 Tax=Vibrio sinus TaxID=2946865 RepID=UPI00202A436A|nr:cytidine deaminase [Vibrio sinus]MCL9783427.1 cytidine deaminase [Vibrio sinus]
MNRQLQEALEHIPAQIKSQLSSIILNDGFTGTISKQQYDQLLSDSTLKDQDLRVALLPIAAAYSYAPISKFYVGAIARGLSGTLYFGANIEFLGTQLGQSIHAEQCAISHAWMKGEEGIKDVTVNYSPCGHCRQFMRETTTAKQLKIQLPERDEKYLEDYLPDSFGPEDLDVKVGLMGDLDHGKKLADNDDPIELQALAALNKSHAPYSGNFSGVALKLQDGDVYNGAYAENAAFNPSLPPLQVALIQMRMAGKAFSQIQSAALIEMASATSSHLADTQATLDALNPDVPVSYIAITEA